MKKGEKIVHYETCKCGEIIAGYSSQVYDNLFEDEEDEFDYSAPVCPSCPRPMEYQEFNK